LDSDIDWPKWESKAAVAFGERQGNADLAVIAVGHR
jgi:hypothetical protein